MEGYGNKTLIYIFFERNLSDCSTATKACKRVSTKASALLVPLFSLMYIAMCCSGVFFLPERNTNLFPMEPFVEALSHPAAYPDTTSALEVVETHISWIFLTDRWAYKVKKPLNLGFLDFSTLQKRHHYCLEELRLNRRLCPDIYHSVVPIVRQEGIYRIEGHEGEIIDYAVKMLRFDRSMELDRMLARHLLTTEHIDRLSGIIAAFHSSLAPAPPHTPFGRPEEVIKPVLANFTHTESAALKRDEAILLETLKAWSIREHQRLTPLLLERKSNGCIRQCHGDMHTGNMVWWKNRIVIFDCIEFNEYLSIIDVISDFSFLFMDLLHAGEAGLAWRLLNNYLAETGDYHALPLLRFYTLYRAMVRAKVTAIRYTQTSDPVLAQKSLEEHRSYVRLAEQCSRKQKPMLLLTCGVSGSGKTVASAALSSTLKALHIRSDIERKRIGGLKALERSNKTSENSLYTDTFSQQTYQRLLEVATLAIQEGITVIVDATFLKSASREVFLELAKAEKIPFRILFFHAPLDILTARVQKRYQKGVDASEADCAVLLQQLEKQEALTPREEALSLQINTGERVDYTHLADILQSVVT